MNRLEQSFERFLFSSRWLLTPFYLGLIISILLLMSKFFLELFHTVGDLPNLNGSQVMVAILGLIDLSLTANLLILITFSGYESFVSKIDLPAEIDGDKPKWIGKVGFNELKVKVVGSIIVISAIELLRTFINIETYTGEEGETMLMWKVILHLTFVMSGFLFAIIDKLSQGSHEH